MATKKKQNLKKQLNEIFILLIISLFSFIFWDSFFIYPIKFFVVILHEVSHALATIFTGGIVKSIFITRNLGGITKTSGGNTFIIATAGYLGSLFFGSLLFISAYKIKLRKWFTTILSVVIFFNVIGYFRNGAQIFSGLIISLFFFLLPRYFNETFGTYFLKFIGLTSCLYVLADIKNDLITTTIRETDAQAIEFITGLPSLSVGFAWLIISLLAIYFLIKYVLKNV